MAHADRIRMLVLHTDPLAREGLCAIFARYADLHVLNEDAKERQALATPRLLAELAVNVVVADYDLGVEMADQIARHTGREEPARVLIVDAVDREWEIRHALSRGVRGYMLFGCALDDLAQGVRAVHWGQRHLSPVVAQRLAESLSADELTAREQEVLRLVVQGLPNKIIARHLEIAVGTVKSHLKGIFDKLNVESRTQAVCAAERRGLLGHARRTGWMSGAGGAAHDGLPLPGTARFESAHEAMAHASAMGR